MVQFPDLNNRIIKTNTFPQIWTGLKAINSKGTLQAVNNVRIIEIKDIHLLAGPVGGEKMTI